MGTDGTPLIEPLAGSLPPAEHKRREEPERPWPPPRRLVSLDLFRGATVVAMIFVNNPGDWGHLYRPFDHAEWHGWTPTDLVFPFFLFIVGVAGVLSLERRMTDGEPKATLLRHVFLRGMTIVLVGWAMAWFPFTLERLHRLRIPGVLPRIGVTFILGTALVIALWRRLAPALPVVIGALLALHTFLLTGLSYDLTREGNIQRAVDLALLKGHLWKVDWDPEGIVSTLTAVATLLTGTLAGLLVKRLRERPSALVLPLLLAGLAGVAAGLVWGQTLPINKNLWTGSYVLLTSGFACVALSLCVLLVDVLRQEGAVSFFLVFGRNPLLAFVLSGMLAKTMGLIKVPSGGKSVSLLSLVYRSSTSWIGDPTLRSHAFALAVVLFWYAVMRAFDRRGWYWKI